MAGIKWLKAPLVVMSALGLLCPGVSAREMESTSKSVVHDVRMNAQGYLLVVVVDAQGQPQPKTSIQVTRSGETRSITGVTNDRGECRIAGLAGGMYRLQTSEGICLCRVWTTRAAPPVAAQSLLIVNDSSLQRGQRPVREMFRSDPILMTAVVAAAIAIPIAIHKSREDDATGS